MPIVATTFVALLSLVLLPFFLTIGMEGLAKVVNFGALSTYILLNLCVIVWFWIRKKDHSNPLRMLIFPILGALITLAVFLSLDTTAKIIGCAWIIVGIIYYLIMTKGLHRTITLE